MISRGGDAGDVNGNRAWLVNASRSPIGSSACEFGGSLYGDTVTLADAAEFDEQIVAAHAAWQKEDPGDHRGGRRVRHDEAGERPRDWSHAFYVQAAYRLPQFNRLWKPYFRFEHIGIDAADAVFSRRAEPRRLDARRPLRRVGVRGAQGRVPDVDARRRRRRATTAGSFRCASRSDAYAAR